ncbi:MAG: hypothetical protein K5899_07845 [Bacteroidaceae bacterium]|nr:hypothetical protein [Bacteroidaceae bacterium]
MNKDRNKTDLRPVTLDGIMTFGQLENGLRTADFECCENVAMDAFTAKCKVQAMRDGNVYMTELPKRIRNKAIFRDDNCSLSKGQNGRFYFVFSLDGEMVEQLPDRLVRQANAIAEKAQQLIHNA